MVLNLPTLSVFVLSSCPSCETTELSDSQHVNEHVWFFLFFCWRLLYLNCFQLPENFLIGLILKPVWFHCHCNTWEMALDRLIYWLIFFWENSITEGKRNLQLENFHRCSFSASSPCVRKKIKFVNIKYKSQMLK